MSTGKAEATPGYRLASHVRDMAKWSYVRPDDHVAMLYAAAAIVESYDALKSREAVLVEALREIASESTGFAGGLDARGCAAKARAALAQVQP
jgi:hypothetical protein